MRSVLACIVWVVLLIGLAACAASSIPPVEAQQQASLAWGQAQHGTFTLTWPQAPLSGPVVFEAWFTANRQQRRFEILQAPAPSLVGLVYISDGASAGYANRLDPIPPVTGGDSLPFSPLSDAFEAVDRLLAQPAQSAQRQTTPSTVAITLTYPTGETLTLKLNPATGLVTQAALTGNNSTFTLTAETQEWLGQPIPNLFKPDFTPYQ